eukprot:maker-scaffold_2-augustus-gene-25.2-mRNA-1 protein AED:0.16 eAED:0.16 QI:216/0/0.33/1/0/0.33/3/0/624
MSYFKNERLPAQENTFFSDVEQKLNTRERVGLLRKLRVLDQKKVDFCSSDYIGLSCDPVLLRNIQDFHSSETKVNGSTGSRLISGNSTFYEVVEDQLKRYHSGKAALLFNSGYDLNLGLFGCLPQSKFDVIIYDELIHNSVREGMKLSRTKNLISFKHNSVDDLEIILQNLPKETKNVFVAVESVYSMDGDLGKLVEVCNLCYKFGALVIVDEAHGVGSFGPQGKVKCFRENLAGRVEILPSDSPIQLVLIPGNERVKKVSEFLNENGIEAVAIRSPTILFSFRKMKVLILGSSLLILINYVYGACPGESPCTGHGTCGAYDLCSCYRNWQGSDCSGRTCPYGKAWADEIDSTVTGREAHHYLECSGKGTCNRDSGECECLEGFTGKGCRRLACPNSCSGHGRCRLMSRANPSYDLWDKDKIQVCDCDPGWTGTDCASRKCKLGDDPLTLHTPDGSAFQVDEVQTISFTTGSGAITGEFTLSYTDWRGETWETHPIDVATATSISIEEALEALPNGAIPQISVSSTGTAASPPLNFLVTFTAEGNSGDQPLLVVNKAGCTVNGCQPVYTGLSGTTPNGAVTETTKGTEERLECSRRGVCDPDSGLCNCFTGYYGEACQLQTVIA